MNDSNCRGEEAVNQAREFLGKLLVMKLDISQGDKSVEVAGN